METTVKPYFLFPSDPFDPRAIDTEFADQANALQDDGFSCAVWQPETNRIRFSQLRPINGEKAVVYRGWMLKEPEYNQLVQAVEAHDAKLITDTDTYLLAHHIPAWYPMISDLTAETVIFPNGTYNLDELPALLKQLGWEKYFVKDYVKSLKTAGGSVLSNLSDLPELIDNMLRYRGEIEGGLCIRKFEEFVPGTEKRFFCLNGIVYHAASDNFGIVVDTMYHPLAAKVRLPSRFYSIDIALRTDGQARVVEVGDGQVSDLVGWKPEEFAGMWVGQ